MQKPSKEELEKLYLIDYYPYTKIASLFLVSPSTIGGWMKSYKILPRKFGEGRIAKGAIKPSKMELEDMYVGKGFSVNRLSKIFGVDKRTIQKLIIRHGFDYRGISQSKLPKDFVKPSREILDNLYKQNMSLKKIGNRFGVASTTVRRWFRDYGLNIMSNPQDRLVKKGIILPSKEQLVEDYNILSLALIAKKYNLPSTQSILTLLDKYGIKKRTRSESRKLAVNAKRVVSWNRGKGMEDPKVAKMMQNLHKRQVERMPEIRLKLSSTYRRKFSENKELREKMRQMALKAKPKYKNTKPEKLMRNILKSEGLTEGLIEQHPVRIGDFITIPDFAYPQHKLAIYCDGEYWHGGFHHLGKKFEDMKEGPRKEKIKEVIKKDEKIHYFLWGNGWAVLRFWQHEIQRNPKEVAEKIRENLFDVDFIKKREEQRKQWYELYGK